MAGPIDIQKNCFYRKHNITSDGAIKLLPSLTDSSLSGTTDFNLEGGTNANTFLVSGATPAALTYGDGQLIGGDLVIYCSGTELSTSGSPPIVDIYATVSGTTFTEGDMELSHGWARLGVDTPVTQSGSITAGQDILTGVGSAFAEDYTIGDDIKVNSAIFKVASITSATVIILDTVSEFGEASAANNLYKPRFYGNELAVYTAHADSGIYTYSENFDGGQTLGEISIPGFKVSEPYISLNSANGAKLASSLYAGGNYSLTYGLYTQWTGDTSGPTGSAFFKEYFGTTIDAARAQTVVQSIGQATLTIGNSVSETSAARDIKRDEHVMMTTVDNPIMYIKPYDENKLDDLWVPANDFREGMENIFAFTPYWRWKDIRGLVQYRTREKTNIEEAEDVNPNNTIFDAGLIYASPNLSTFYGAGDESGIPVNKSIIQISNEAYDDGGSSLQLYNLWSYSKLNAYQVSQDGLDPMYGVSGAANPQFTCVGMKNVPFPQQIDNAFNVNGVTNNDPAWDNATLPEINLKFNVKEMDVNPTIASSFDGTIAEQKVVKGSFTDYWGANQTAGAAVDRYTDTQLISGTTDWSLAGGPFDYQFRTLMRNFTICFSNYPPEEGEGLDNFIHRGLKDYYSGTTVGKKTIGGLTVFRDRSAMGNINSAGVSGSEITKGDGNVLTAMALQVANSAYANGNASSGYPTAGTMDISNARNRILKFNNSQFNTDQPANLMCFAAIPANDGNPDNDMGTFSSVYDNSINLSMDQFINAKFCFNVLGGSAGGAFGAASDNKGKADQCRVYFTEGVIETTASTQDESSDMLSAGTVEQPYSLPIYFPTSTHNTTSGIGQTWLQQPALWPRFMTLWVTNYRNTNSSSVDTDDLSGEKQPWSTYNLSSGKNDFGLTSDYPGDVGADKQTNVFVDSIHFSNFTNAVHNASARSTGLTDNIVIKAWPNKSPVATPPKYTDYDAAVGQAAMPASMLAQSISNYQMPTYVILGFDNGPADFYASGGADPGTTQWYQWHGFGTPSFSNLSRQAKETTTHNMSWFRHDSQSGLLNSYGNYLQNSFYSYRFYTDYATTATPTYCIGSSPQRGFLQTVPTFGATQPTTGSNEIFNFATGSATHLFTDGLTQKGFTQFGAKGDAFADNDYEGSWLKREHPFVSAKITKIPESFDENDIPEKGVIEVDRAAIFDMPLSDEYIIYTVGGGTASLRPHANIIAEGSAAAPYWDYQTKTTTLNFSGTLDATETTIDIATASATAYYDAWIPSQNRNIDYSNYFYTGSYMALIDGDDAVQEIVKVEAYVIGGGATGYDRVTIARGQMGTPAASRAGAAYYIYPLVNVFSIKGVTQAKAKDGNKIFLNCPQIDSILTDRNLPYLYISPYKYWQWFQMWPGEVATGDAETGLAVVNGTSSGPKAYSAISLMKSGSAATTATGTTYSEKDYTFLSAMTGSVGRMSPYNYLWNLETATSGSTIETNVDYGLGPYTEDTRTGGQVASRAVYTETPIAFNLDGLINSTNWGNEDPVVNKIVLGSPLLSSSAVFYGNDYTTRIPMTGTASGTTIIQEDVKPYYLWKYFDAVPTVANFTVGPAFNLLNRETNLYSLTNENLNGVSFNWSEGGEDIWYRMLIVDNKAVYSKYHGFGNTSAFPLLYAPLNDIPISVTSKPTLTFTEGTTGTGGDFEPTVSDGGRMSPEGLQGYAYDTGVSGASATIEILAADTKMTYAQDKYTAIFHLTPGIYTGATDQTIFSRGTATASGSLVIQMDNGAIHATMGGISSPLISKTISPRNAKQPIMVAVVYDRLGDVPCKLFINGKLEDYSLTGTTNANESLVSSYLCNNSGSTEPYYGLIEEVILYADVIHFPDDTGKYILDGSRYQEFTNDVQSLHGKLFIMDYHNIRGDGKDTLCSSPTVSWRSTIA